MEGQADRTPEKGQRTLDPHCAHELDDEVLSQEITLLGDLVLAASSATQHLTTDEVDQILELHGDGRQR